MGQLRVRGPFASKVKVNTNIKHSYKLCLWAVHTEQLAPPAVTTNLDHDALTAWVDAIRASGKPVVGTITVPPQVEGAPEILVEAYAYGVEEKIDIAWLHYAVGSDATEHLLGKAPIVVDGWTLMLDCVPAATQTILPPQKNIDSGYRCDGCKRFSLKQGQDWLNTVTHRFDGGAQEHMWTDTVNMITKLHDVEAPETLKTFGLCLKHQRLVHAYFPGCEDHAGVAPWTPRTGV